MKHDKISEKLFIKNRKKLFDILQKGEIAIIVSNINYPKNGDQFYPFRQDSDFYYLSGINEDSAVLFMLKDENEECREDVFIKKTSEKIKLWDGPRLDKKEAEKVSGIKNVHWLDELENIGREMLSGANKLSLNLKGNRRSEQKIPSPAEIFKNRFSNFLSGFEISDISGRIHELRLVKEPEEIEMIKKAVSITKSFYFKILNRLKPGIKEYEIEALMKKEFLFSGAEDFAFAPIVASGKNACILHYIKNDSVCRDGEILLMDFGAEYGLYPADCSRSIPVNGRYTKRQKQIYQAVLDIFKDAKRLFRPGTTINEINNATGELMENKLREIGLLTCEEINNETKDQAAYKKFFPHGTTHFIGLDVHDVGGKDVPLKPGMVLSCEPGIYIEEEKLGIRIETDMLITKDGADDLMYDFPVEPEEIEKEMR